MPRIVHRPGPFGGRHVVETTTIDADSLISAFEEGASAEEMSQRWPALPEGALEAALEWRGSGRPHHARIALTPLGFVLEGSQATARMLLALADHGHGEDGLDDAIEAAVAWRRSYDELGIDELSFSALLEAGPEIWMHLSPAERDCDPSVLGVSPVERYGATHGGYAALVWLADTSSLRIVPILSNGPDAARDVQQEIDLLIEIGRTMLITWRKDGNRPTLAAEAIRLPEGRWPDEPSSVPDDPVADRDDSGASAVLTHSPL